MLANQYVVSKISNVSTPNTSASTLIIHRTYICFDQGNREWPNWQITELIDFPWIKFDLDYAGATTPE